MNDKVDKALNRLQHILPLKANQDKCDAQIKRLHREILQSFVSQGRILNADEMTQWVDNLPQAINILSKNDMLTCSKDGEPIGAYPFTMSTREHRVRVNGYELHAMCALDALAIAPMFNTSTDINSHCKVSGNAINIQMQGEGILNHNASADIHFGIAWGAADAASSCADSLCMEMIFLQNTETAEKWLADDALEREIFTLQDAVQFSSQFFVPLLK